MGHSLGEYVAACVAGVFSLEEGLRLVAIRGNLMQALPHDGAMVAVLTDVDSLATMIAPYQQRVSISAINGPKSSVISGARDEIKSIVALCQADNIPTIQLRVSHAFHSPLMEPILEPFEAAAAAVHLSSPRIGLVSNVTGGLVSDELKQASYWRRQIRQPVLFKQSMATLEASGCTIFLEIGPKPTLLTMGRYCLPASQPAWLSSLHPNFPDGQQMLQSLAEMYLRGVPVNWREFVSDFQTRKVHLPTYPFQRNRCWYK